MTRSTVRLGDLGRVVTGRTPAAAHPEYWGDDLPFLTPSDMDGSRIVQHFGRRLSPVGAEAMKSAVVPYGVGVSCIGWQMGKAVYIPTPVLTNQQINTIVFAPKIVDGLFLYYAMSSRREEIFRLGSGGSRTPILNKSSFEDVRIELPTLPEQRRIAAVLGSLDDKIELNRRMIHTLGDLVAALYKSWFIDFDPVQARRDGRGCAGISDLSLFPEHFEQSDLGPIPATWRVSTLGEVVETIDCLHSRKPKRVEVGRPLLQLENIRDDGTMDLRNLFLISDTDYRVWTSRIEAAAGDCVITNVGRVGAVAQIPQGFKAALGRNMTAVKPLNSFPYPTFIIQCLSSDSMCDEIQAKTDTGTILDSLNVRTIPQLRFIQPSQPVVEHFEKLARPLRHQMEQHQSETLLLERIRTMLLAPLLSGEITFREAQQTVSEVA
jgi:type I restriction enzyme S subunit